MKVTLDQIEIEAAIKEHIGPTGWGIPLEGKVMSITLKSHRGENAFSADIELKDAPKPKSEKKGKADEEDQAIDFDYVEDDD